MNKNLVKLFKKAILALPILVIFVTGTAYADVTYDFESDTVGQAPAGITPASGVTSNVESGANGTTGNYFHITGAASGAKTAVVTLDNFPSAKNYSVTWKSRYTGADTNRSAVVFRGFGDNSGGNIRPGLNKGYLFQVQNDNEKLVVWESNGGSPAFNRLADYDLTAQGADTDRWYRATIQDNHLTFEYSDDGINFTTAIDLINSTYPDAGKTQFATGWGVVGAIDNDFVDDIVFINLDTGVTITTPKEYQVFQRDDTSNADIEISGTYTGNCTSIEASFNGGAYTSIDASPSGGSYSGTLQGSVGQGDLVVRCGNDHNASETVSHVGVGDIFVISGQSNASGHGVHLNSYTHPSLKATLFGNDDVWKDLTDPTDSDTNQVDGVSADSAAYGSPWPLVATQIMTSKNIPVAFVPAAKGATDIQQWQPGSNHSDTSTLYGSMNRRITAVGGRVKGNLFFQGERNARYGASTYEADLTTFVDTVAGDFPGTKTMIGMTGPGPHAYEAHIDEVRNAQFSVADTNANAVLGPATYDINLSDESSVSPDGLHFKSDADMGKFADRWAKAILKEFYSETDGHGPVVDENNLVYDVANNKIIVPFTDESSPAIDSASTVATSSFSLTNGGTNQTISSVAIVGDTVEITPANNLDITKSIKLSYARKNTGVDHAVYDTNDLPALPFYDLDVIPKGAVEFSVDSSDDEDSGAQLPQILVKGTIINPTTVKVTDAGTGTAGSGDYSFSSPQLVTIPAGTYDGTTNTAITIPGLSITADTDVEPNETINFTLSDATGDVFIGDANGDSTTDTDQRYTINNDDYYSVSIAKTTDGSEPNTDTEFTISLSSTNNSGSPITGDIAFSGTATEGTDYATGPTSFSIPDGSSSTTVTLTTTDDTDVEGVETIIATISNPSAGSIGTATATANLNDDDQAQNSGHSRSRRISRARLREIFRISTSSQESNSEMGKMSEGGEGGDHITTDSTTPSCSVHVTRLIKRGMVGKDVREIQHCMNFFGYRVGPEDGIYGQLTYKGIIAYQKAKHMKWIDGIVGPETTASLNALGSE